jgi:hypothetical protein
MRHKSDTHNQFFYHNEDIDVYEEDVIVKVLASPKVVPNVYLFDCQELAVYNGSWH